MTADMHTHTSYSPDASSSPEEMCRRAAELGLKALAVTDHCDCNLWLPLDELGREVTVDKEMYGSRDYAQASITRIAELKERYPFLLCGTELGQPLQNRAAAETILSRPELDFVIGSHHMNADRDDFYWLDYRKMELTEIYSLMDDCFAETLEMCRQVSFDVLGHLTYPLRYITGECGIVLDMKRYDEVIRAIFRTLAENGRGIEINTSGLRQRFGRTLPDLEYVRLYRECGGEIITVGSDAHKAADLGAGIDDGEQLAREAGFKYIAVYRGRKPQFEKL